MNMGPHMQAAIEAVRQAWYAQNDAYHDGKIDKATYERLLAQRGSIFHEAERLLEAQQRERMQQRERIQPRPATNTARGNPVLAALTEALARAPNQVKAAFREALAEFSGQQSQVKPAPPPVPEPQSRRASDTGDGESVEEVRKATRAWITRQYGPERSGHRS